MLSIKNTFVNRKSWINTRSSTIFPVYLNNNNDQILVFQNYWKWKSNILNINFILTLRDQNSKIINQLKYKVKNHNEIFGIWAIFSTSYTEIGIIFVTYYINTADLTELFYYDIINVYILWLYLKYSCHFKIVLIHETQFHG